jgi:hypothetical protein
MEAYLVISEMKHEFGHALAPHSLPLIRTRSCTTQSPINYLILYRSFKERVKIICDVRETGLAPARD